ncbi:hypothetical protein BDZ89DRAFT_1129430 [Hymenopellis radicata]|nr:hypothetical protein BDZ89DRAFT_1129430 [Hymenopellis radicata]
MSIAGSSTSYEAFGPEVVEVLVKSLKEAQARVNTAQAQATDANIKVTELRAQNEDLEETKKALTEHIEAFKKEIHQLKLENIELADRKKGKPEGNLVVQPVPTSAEDIASKTEEMTTKVAEQEGKITELESAVASWEGRFNEEKMKKRTARKERDALSVQLQTISSGKDDLDGRIQALRYEMDTLKEALKTSKSDKDLLNAKVKTLQENINALNAAWSLHTKSLSSYSNGVAIRGRKERALLNSLMAIHQPVIQRPLDMKPIWELDPTMLSSEALDEKMIHFIGAASTEWEHQNLLFSKAPGRIVWCDEPHGNGYLYAPMHNLIVSPNGNRWNTKGRPMQEFYNKEINLLVLDDKGALWYSGIYKCIALHAYMPAGCTNFASINRRDMTDSTLKVEDQDQGQVSENRYHRAAAFVTKLWDSPFSRAECLGLQCVGFKHELYESLRVKAKRWDWMEVPNSEAGDSSHDQRELSEDDRPVKKRKM